MKYCDMCGTSLKDDDRFCSDCGTACSTDTSDSFDNDCSKSGKNIIENIEKRVAKYYNDTYLSAGKSGKYVVLQHETTVSGDMCNVVVRYQDNNDSDNSSAYASVADVSVNVITGECTMHSRPINRISKRTGAHVFICIVAVIIMLNIFCIPFLCNEFWDIGDDHASHNARYFLTMIEDLSDGYSANASVPIDGIYYIGGLISALFIFVSAIGKNSGACVVGSLVGIGLLLYLFYQINSTIWYVGGNNAHLTVGFYISCVGFVSLLIASLYKEKR